MPNFSPLTFPDPRNPAAEGLPFGRLLVLLMQTLALNQYQVGDFVKAAALPEERAMVGEVRNQQISRWTRANRPTVPDPVKQSLIIKLLAREAKRKRLFRTRTQEKNEK